MPDLLVQLPFLCFGHVVQAHARPTATGWQGWLVFFGEDGRILESGPHTAPVSSAQVREWADGLVPEEISSLLEAAVFVGGFASATRPMPLS